jgi:hypothetical protein
MNYGFMMPCIGIVIDSFRNQRVSLILIDVVKWGNLGVEETFAMNWCCGSFFDTQLCNVGSVA